MSEHLALRRLRSLLRRVTTALFVGIIVELLLTDHTDDPIQVVPFMLAGLGLVTLAASWWWPGRWTVRALRLTLVAVTLGSLFGVAQHFLGNLEFGRETRPELDTLGLLMAALTGGAPLLAPGILAVTAMLGVAAIDTPGSPDTRHR